MRKEKGCFHNDIKSGYFCVELRNKSVFCSVGGLERINNILLLPTDQLVNCLKKRCILVWVRYINKCIRKLKK